jgi:GNAT superfamily N-acetyltransferase
MLTTRPANAGDVNFLVWIDIKDDGVSSSYMANWADAEWAKHRLQIAAYISSEDKFAFVTEEIDTKRRVAGIYADILNVQGVVDRWRMFQTISTELFPEDGRFCAIFQLWVDPAYRRQGLGSHLKKWWKTKRCGVKSGRFTPTPRPATNMSSRQTKSWATQKFIAVPCGMRSSAWPCLNR